MKGKQVWAKGLAIALFIALAMFVPTGLAFADHEECRDIWSARASGIPESALDEICPISNEEVALEAAAASPYVLSPLSWVTEGSNIPADVINEIRFLTNKEVTVESAEVPGFVPSGLSWVTESSNIPAEILNEIRFLTNRDVTVESADVASSVALSDLNIPESVLQEIRFWTNPEVVSMAPSLPSDANIPEDILQKLRYWTGPEVTSSTIIRSSVDRGKVYWEEVLGREQETMSMQGSFGIAADGRGESYWEYILERSSGLTP